MTRPLATRLSALCDLENAYPTVLQDAANAYNIPYDWMFDGKKSMTEDHHLARLEVVRKLLAASPNASNPQLATLLGLNPKSVRSMREAVETMTFKGHSWRLP